MSTTPTAPPVEQPKHKWEFADGKVYEAETPEKLLELVGKRYNDLYPEFERLKQENTNYQQVVQQAQGQEQPPQQVPDDKFDQQKYWTLMAQNPIEGQRYLNRFDPEYNQAVQDLEGVKQMQHANAFKAQNPDFPENDEAAVNKLAQTCNLLFPNARVITAEQMSAAYALMSRQKQQPTTPNPPAPAAPPNAAATPTQGAINPEAMDQKQLREYILSLEAQQAR